MNIKKILSATLAVAMVATMSTSVFALELTGDKLADSTKLDVAAGTYDDAKYNEVEVATGYDADDATNRMGSTVVTVDSEATMFKVTVPIKLHVTQKADGSRVFEDSMTAGGTVSATETRTAKIINECPLGQVKVVDVKIVPSTGYTVSAFDADFANMKVNSKTFGMKMNGKDVAADGVVVTANAATDTITSALANASDGKTDVARVYSDYTFTYSAAEGSRSNFPVIANGSVLPIEYEIKLPAYSETVTNAVYGGVVYTFEFN